MNLLTQASELFLLLQESKLFHVRQIPLVQVIPSGADPGDQSYLHGRVSGSLPVSFRRDAVEGEHGPEQMAT
jgi:hypothetical protein